MPPDSQNAVESRRKPILLAACIGCDRLLVLDATSYPRANPMQRRCWLAELIVFITLVPVLITLEVTYLLVDSVSSNKILED